MAVEEGGKRKGNDDSVKTPRSAGEAPGPHPRTTTLDTNATVSIPRTAGAIHDERSRMRVPS